MCNVTIHFHHDTVCPKQAWSPQGPLKDLWLSNQSTFKLCSCHLLSGSHLSGIHLPVSSSDRHSSCGYPTTWIKNNPLTHVIPRSCKCLPGYLYGFPVFHRWDASAAQALSWTWYLLRDTSRSIPWGLVMEEPALIVGSSILWTIQGKWRDIKKPTESLSLLGPLLFKLPQHRIQKLV